MILSWKEMLVFFCFLPSPHSLLKSSSTVSQNYGKPNIVLSLPFKNLSMYCVASTVVDITRTTHTHIIKFLATRSLQLS